MKRGGCVLGIDLTSDPHHLSDTNQTIKVCLYWCVDQHCPLSKARLQIRRPGKTFFVCLYCVFIHTLLSFHFTRMYLTFYGKNCSLKHGCILWQKTATTVFVVSNKTSARACVWNVVGKPLSWLWQQKCSATIRRNRRQPIVFKNLCNSLFILSDA